MKFVNCYSLYGSPGRAHTVSGSAALKGRAAGAATAHQPFLVSQHHFAVGSDVNEKTDLFRVRNARCQRAGGNVAAHVTGYAGHTGQKPASIDPNSRFRGSDHREKIRSGNVRFAPDISGVNSQYKVGHGCVAGAHDAGDVVQVDIISARQVYDELIYVPYYGLVQSLQAVVLCRINYAGDEFYASSRSSLEYVFALLLGGLLLSSG